MANFDEQTIAGSIRRSHSMRRGMQNAVRRMWRQRWMMANTEIMEPEITKLFDLVLGAISVMKK
ncbi:hypothetical protein AKJ16_DCAP01951, partial [Drosera capensis]